MTLIITPSDEHPVLCIHENGKHIWHKNEHSFENPLIHLFLIAQNGPATQVYFVTHNGRLEISIIEEYGPLN